MAIPAPSYYWKLDEASGNAIDSVSSSVLTNTSTTYGAGKLNNAAIFNGSSSRLRGVAGVLAASGDFSISFWYYGNAASGQVLCDWVSAKRNVYIYAISNAIYMWRGNGGGSQSPSPVISTAVANNTWTHVVFTQSGTTGTVYLNGSSNATSNLTYTGGAATSNLLDVGYYDNGAPSAFINAQLDEIYVLNGAALTSGEVSELYGAGTPPSYPFTGGGSPTPSRLMMMGVG